MRKRLSPDHPLIRIETKFGNAEAYGRLAILAFMTAICAACFSLIACLVWGYLK
jgi:hypothetical protein